MTHHMSDDHCSRWGGIPQAPQTEFTRRAIGLLCRAYGMGPWNIPVTWERVNWRYGNGVSFILNCWGHGFASYDTNRLTRLVIGAHDEMIRVEISPRSFRYLEIAMWPRKGREGPMYSRHPTIEDAVAGFRGEDMPPVPVPVATVYKGSQIAELMGITEDTTLYRISKGEAA
ncbi:hypothetical protein ACC862_24120 [Rhizobium ruizarguesonis]